MWLFTGAVKDGLCGEGTAQAQALIAPAANGRVRAELNAAQPGAETAEIEQAQALAQERDRADALAHELATLRAELDVARMAGKDAIQAIEVGIRQTQALEQERDKSNNLAHELALVRAELDMARISVANAVQAPEEDIKQAQAIEQERGRAENLARELAAAQAELDTVRNAASDAAQTTAAGVEQKQALERELKRRRDEAEALARQLSSLRAEVDTTRAALSEATRIAEAAKAEQKPVPAKERDSTATRALALAQNRAEECSARLAAAYAEILQVTGVAAAEQKHALLKMGERAEALARELASVGTELEARDRQLAALNASRALISPKPSADNAHAPVVTSGSQMAKGMSRLPEWTSVQAAALRLGRPSASEFPSLDARTSSRESARDPGPNVTLAPEGFAPGNSAARSLVDEQRLLAHANALLRQADISGARQLLEHALEHGSARAAFMLAETYDARVLQSWRTRGISGDRARARELYERAQAGGIEDAKERIKILQSLSAR